MTEAKTLVSFDAVIKEITAIEDNYQTLRNRLEDFETWSMLKPKLSQKRKETLKRCSKNIELIRAIKTRYEAAQSAQRAQSFPIFKAHYEHEDMKIASYFVIMRSQAIGWLNGFVKKMHWIYLQEKKDQGLFDKIRSSPIKQLSLHKQELSKSIKALSQQEAAIEMQAAKLIYDNPSISVDENNSGSSMKLAAELFKLEEQLNHFVSTIDDAKNEMKTENNVHYKNKENEELESNDQSFHQKSDASFDYIGLRRYQNTKEQLELAGNFIRQTLVRMTENHTPSHWE